MALKSSAVDVDTKASLAVAANEARGLAMDSIAAAHSGHMGLPLGAAEIGATLYGGAVSLFCNLLSYAFEAVMYHIRVLKYLGHLNNLLKFSPLTFF
jgi:hypothetical protein